MLIQPLRLNLFTIENHGLAHRVVDSDRGGVEAKLFSRSDRKKLGEILSS